MAFGGLTNWFKKRVEDVRDVFDANTPADQRRRLAAGQPRYYQDQQAAQKQVQPQQQFYNQPPSYGGGLNGLSNLFKDVFDANTPQDQYKRLSVGAPKDYVRQQAKLNQQAQQDPLRRSGIEQFGKNLLGGVAEFAGKAPGAILDFKGSYDKSTPGKILNYSNPLLMGQNLANLTVDKLTGKPIGTTSDRNATNLQKFGRGFQDIVENKIQQSSLGQRESDNKWIAGSGRAIGNVGGQVAATVLSGGTTIPALLSGSQTFSDQQKAAKQAGKTDEEAFGIGALQGLVESASEKIGLDKLKVPGAGNFAVKTLKRFGTEGTQEAGQQFLQNLVTNKTYNQNQGLTEGVKEAGIFGGLAGGVAGSAFDFNPKEFKQANQQLANNQIGAVGKNVNNPLESLKQEARKYKSAEEFVKNNFVAHGTNKEILGNLQPTNGWYGKAVYTTDDLANASGRNGGGVTYFVNKPQGKLLEINAHGSKGGSGFTPQQYQDAIKNGYDGLKIKHDDGKTWYAMFNEQTPHTKQQLTDLYNQATQSQPPKSTPVQKVDPLESLKQEARKYKSAEEFVNSQRLYKGLTKDGSSTSSTFGKAVYTSPHEHIAQKYDNGGGLVEMHLKPGSRTINWQDAEYKAVKEKFMEQVPGGEAGYRKPNYDKINTELKKRGYDAVTFATDGQSSPMTAILNKKAISNDTKQLTDLYNQATKPKAYYQNVPKSNDPLEALKAEARKYKSADEFIRAQGEPVYHGTTEKIQGDFKYPLYTTPKRDYAQVFADSASASSIAKSGVKAKDAAMVHEFAVNPKARVMDIHDPTVRDLLNKEYFGKYSMSDKFYPGQNGHLDWTEGQNLAEFIHDKKLPYDAIKLDEGGGGVDPQFGRKVIDKGVSYLALNKNALRSKQQLTVLYNQATQPPKPTLTRTLEQISASQSELAQRIISAKQSGDTKAIPKLKEELDAIKTELDNAQSSLTTPLKPKGFIIKETKPRGGKVDTVRVGINPQKTALQTTTQTEPTPEALQYAQAFGITPEQAIQDLNNQQADLSGTQSALNNVQNSGSNNIVQDLQDQQDYGVKEIQEKPTNTIDDVIGKYLDTEVLTDEQLNQSNRDQGLLGKPREIRDTVRKGNVFRIANNAVAKGLEMSSRGNVIGRKLTRVAQYINKNAGQDPAMIEAAQKYAGENTYADSSLLQVGKQAYDLVPNDVSRARVHAVLDPESADGAVKYDDLTQNEKQAADMLRDLGDAINDTSYRTGFISRKKWQSNRGGRYIARLYNEIATSEDVADLLDLPDIRGLHLGMYKSRVDLNEDLKQRLIRDPIKLAVIRARQVRQNEALMQYMQTAESKGYVTNKPTAGFIKVAPGNRMANWGGRYVRQDVYENIEGFKAMGKFINSVNNVLDVYDGNPLRRMRKKLLTIYNPIIRTGNVTSNYFFAYLNGINPITFQKNKIWASRALKRNDPLVIAAQRANLVGNDIVKSDKNIFNKDKAFLTDLDRNSQSVFAKIKGTPKKIDEKLSDRYGNTDDKAKIAALKTQVDRGYSVNQAIEMTRKGFQDYSRVGHAYDMAAKSPIFGNAFIRFQGDLWMNIVKNAAIDHPLRLASLPLGVAVLGEALSNLAGEDDEDKKTREERAGTASIPFTKILNQGISKVTGGEFGGDRNISLEFQMPDVKKFLETGERKSVGAVDVARFTPLYMRQDIDGGSLADDLSRVLPVGVPDPSKLSGPEAKSEIIKRMATDPLIGPVISILGDTDWRGKSVSDPEGVRKGKAVYPDDPLSNKEKWQNRLQYGVRSYAPYPANEIGDIMAFMSGDAKTEQTKGGKDLPDNTGKSMLSREGFNTQGTRKTVGQGLARLFGIRAEKFGPDEASGKRERDQMFAFFDKQDRFKDTLDSETRTAFDNRHRSTRTRDGIKQEFENDPWWKYKSASELLQNPKLFKAEKKYAELQNKYDGKPIDPVFDLPKDQRNLVLAKKLKMPGAKDEGFNTLYDQEWYQNFRDKQDKYYSEKKAYNKSRGFKEQEVDNPYPEADKNLQKAMDAYFALPSGTGDRSAFIRNNPDTWNAITAQWDKQNAWTDKERKKLGLPKINRDDDKFGYSNSKGGKSGKGGRGGRKSKSPNLPSFTIANYPRVNKVKISSKKAPSTTLKVPTVKIKTSKAKITIAKQAKKIKKTSSMV